MMKKRITTMATSTLALCWSMTVMAQEAEVKVAVPQPEVTAEADVATEAPAPPEADTAAEASAEVEAEVAAPEPAVEPAPVAPEPAVEAEVAAPAPEVEAPAEPEPEEAEAPKSYLDPKFNIGTGLRVAYTLDTNVPDDNFAHVMGTNIRPYMSGQVSEHIKFEANFDSTFSQAGGDAFATVRLLDAVLKFELSPLAHFWVGRFLPPSDRANLSGPYFQNAWNYPVNANLFPAIFAGRHDGLAYFGQVGEGKFKWQLGVFDATYDDNPLFAGRVVLNLLDPESGYYNSSTYYGSKEVLAIAGTLHYQDGGDPGTGIDGAAAEVEVLFEKPLDGSGTFTAEAAYYNFTDTEQGQSFNGLLSYLLPGKQGVGTLQPAARLQLMIPEEGDTYPTIDAAMNYIVDGHNARFTLTYQHVGSHDGIDSDDLITLGGQIQMF